MKQSRPFLLGHKELVEDLIGGRAHKTPHRPVPGGVATWLCSGGLKEYQLKSSQRIQVPNI